MASKARRLADLLRREGPGGMLLVVTGAGISRASGIATFRGSEPDAVWKVSDKELATGEYFQRDPVGQWLWYIERFARIGEARPNPAHRAVAELERRQLAAGGRFQLITQNIDTLHEQAGSRNLIKVHGTSDRVRCARRGCRHGAPHGSLPGSRVDFVAFRARPDRDTLPRCPACGDILRAHVLFFDEYYQEHDDYRFEETLTAAEEARVLLFVGTSFSVGITEIFLRTAQWRGAPAFSIDPNPVAEIARFDVEAIAAPAEEFLPELCRELAAAA